MTLDRYDPDFEDDGASFRIRRAAELQRRYAPTGRRTPFGLHPFILHIVVWPIVVTGIFFAGAVLFAILYAIGEAVLG